MKLTQSCQLNDLLKFFAIRLGKTYEEVQILADALFSNGFIIFVTFQFGLALEGTFTYEIQKYMRDIGITELYIILD